MDNQDQPFQQVENVDRIENDTSRKTPYPQARPLIGITFIVSGLLMEISGSLIVTLVILSIKYYRENSETVVWFVMSLPISLQSLISYVWTHWLFFTITGALSVGVGLLLVNLGRRYLVTTYPASTLSDSGDKILYLRPFITDKSLTSGYKPFEEFISKAFRSIGRPVAIEDPRERLPSLGALRVYPDESSIATVGTRETQWKTVVAEQIASAMLILIHIGTSEAIRWEIERVVAIADPKRVLLCFNPPNLIFKFIKTHDAFRSEVDAAWRQFREVCGPIFPQNLPETIGDSLFVKFDANWTAEPLQVMYKKIAWFMPQRAPRPRQGTIDAVIAELLRAMIPEPFPRRFARWCINFMTFIFASIAVFQFK
jgi:hypothetical protein